MSIKWVNDHLGLHFTQGCTVWHREVENIGCCPSQANFLSSHKATETYLVWEVRPKSICDPHNPSTGTESTCGLHLTSSWQICEHLPTPWYGECVEEDTVTEDIVMCSICCMPTNLLSQWCVLTMLSSDISDWQLHDRTEWDHTFIIPQCRSWLHWPGHPSPANESNLDLEAGHPKMTGSSWMQHCWIQGEYSSALKTTAIYIKNN